MKFSRFSIKIWFIFNIALNNVINGESIFDKLSNSLLESLGLTTEHPEVTEGPTVPTKIVHPEETIFNLAPKLQGFLDSSDIQSKENFIISPLSTVAIFGQLLIGLRGLNHELICDLLSLKHERKKRGVIIIQESNDTLYDYTLYHGAFHFKLMTMIRKVLSDKPEDKVSLDYVMFYQQGTDFVPHFMTNMNKVYKPTLVTVPIDFQDISKSTDTIDEWGKQHMELDLANRLSHVVIPQSQGFLLHTLVIDCRWKTPMERTGPEDFFVSPYQTVKVNYLRASLSTSYVDHADFTLVSIPLNHDDTNVYVLLPKGNNYNIQQFSQNLNSDYFQNILENFQSAKDVDIKIPDVFYQYVNIDIMRPLRNYFNDVTERRGKEHDGILKLNGAAENFNIDNLLQDMYLSITNGDREGLPKPFQSGYSNQYSTQPHSTIETNKYPVSPEVNSFNTPYNTQQSYPTGQSPSKNIINMVMDNGGISSHHNTQQPYSTGQSSGYGEGNSVGENNANMGMGEISSQYNTQQSYSTGQRPSENNVNTGMGGIFPQHNIEQTYSTGQSPERSKGYSVGQNNTNMGMGGISSQYNTQQSYSTGQRPSENNVNTGMGGIFPQHNTEQTYSTGQSPGHSEGYSVGPNNANMGMGGISSQYNTQQSYSTGQRPSENNVNTGMGGIFPQHNTEQTYSTGQSPGHSEGYSVGPNNANMGMGGISSQYNTQQSYSTGQRPSENNVNTGMGGISSQHNTKQSYSTGQSPGYEEVSSVGGNNINMGMDGISSQYNTQQSYSTGQRPSKNKVNSGMGGIFPQQNTQLSYSTGQRPSENNANMGMGGISLQHNTKQSYSTGQSPGYGEVSSVGENNINMGMGGISSQYNTQQSYSTGQRPSEINVNMGMGGISLHHNTKQTYSTGQSPGYGEVSSVGENNINMGIGGISSQYNTQQSYSTGQRPSEINVNMGKGGISSQHSVGWYNEGSKYPAVPQSSLLNAPGYNTQGFQYQTNIPLQNPVVPTNNYYSSIDSYPKNAFSSHASIGSNKHVSTASMGQGMFLRKKRDWGAINFEVTRPFLFIIMTEKNKIVLVWGCISNPANLQV